jgi:hypothetical protein
MLIKAKLDIEGDEPVVSSGLVCMNSQLNNK